MKVFALDLWHDLRSKRLWPVAVLLLAAVIAVPVFLLDRGSEDTATKAAAPAVAVGAPGSPQAAVRPADVAGENSDLGEFSSKDPFEAPAGDGGDAADTGAGAGSSPTGGDVSSLPDGGSADAVSGGGSSGGSAPGGSEQGSSEGETKGEGEPKQESPSTPTTAFAYTVDIDFGRAGRTHLRRDVVPLEILPDKRRPLLVFMGVTETRRTAMFQVDGGLKQEGEGICLPSRKDCRFVYLRVDQGRNVHFFTDPQGRKYTLKLLDIDRVPLSDLASKKSRTSKASKRSSTYTNAPSLLSGER